MKEILEIHNYVEINPLLNNQQIKEEITSERKYLVLSENEDITHQNSQYTAKAVCNKKFIAVNNYI